MQNYGETTDPKTGKKGYMRINSRDGETITISNVNFSAGGSQELSNAVSGGRSGRGVGGGREGRMEI